MRARTHLPAPAPVGHRGFGKGAAFAPGEASFYTGGVAPPPLVRFENVSYIASGRVVLRRVNLAVRPGDVLGVSGPNGAGKTTLLRLAATLHRPSKGAFQVLEAGAGARPEELAAVRRQIAMIGHFPAVWPELTLRENVDLVTRLRGGAQAVDPLAAVGLERLEDWKASRASLGMQRRVEFARLLNWTPRLLLLDEPHAGLDAASAPLVDEVVGRVAANGGAAVLVSHDPGRMTPLVNRKLLVTAGEVSEEKQGDGG